jgi:PAS domain S-box-containing protein
VDAPATRRNHAAMRILSRSPRRPTIRQGEAAETGGLPLSACLLGIVFAVSLPLVALVGATVWGQYCADRSRSQAQLEAEARGIAQQVDQEFVALETVARTLANAPALARGDLPAFAQDMQAARAALSASNLPSAGMVRIRLLSRDGTQRVDTRDDGGKVIPARPFALRAMATGMPQVSELLHENHSGAAYVGVAVPVFEPGTRRVAGAIVTTILRQRLLALARAAALPPGGAASVQDRNGVTVAHSLHDDTTLGRPPSAAVLRAILSTPAGVMPAIRDAAGAFTTVAYARAPASGFTVLLDVPTSTFLAPVRHVLIRTAAIAAAVVLACAFLSILLSRGITRAFHRVAAMAARRADGVASQPTGLREADQLAAVLGETLTERAHAERRLSESEERLRLAVEAAEIGLWDVDPIANRLYWPPVVKAMFGISPDVPASMTDFFARLHPDDHDRVITAYSAALDPQQRALYDVVYRTIGKEDGVVRWIAAKGRAIFDDTGRCVRVIGTCIDTSVRRATARQLRELNETLEQRVAQATQERDRVWRNSRDILAVVDTRGVLRAVNPAATAILGYEPREVVGRNFLQFVWPPDITRARRGFETASSGSNLTSFQVRFRHKDATQRWLSWHTTREGTLVYAYGRDVTVEKAAAAELLTAQETLHQAQKIETIGQLTGGVAHDFNNLLTPIVGALDMMVLRSETGSRSQRIANAAQQAADKARTLIQRLLAFSRRQHLEARAVDVRGLIDGLADLAARSLGPQIRMIIAVENDLAPAWVDPNQLELALLNLAVNGRDAMAGVGTLTVTATEETAILQGKLLPAQYIRISVTDTGCGMDAETLQRAVEPFFTTKTVGRGTGLGLSMVHGLAAQSGGDFTLESAVGEGTTATLRLPVSQTATAAARSDLPPEAVPDSVRRATILLVDDEDLVRTGVAEMLSDAGFTVAQADSGIEAVGMVQAGLRPDVLVTDYAMPGMTGAALARALRALLPDLPVLMVTGYARLESDDGDDLPRLAKPFRQRDIVAVLSGLLRDTKVLEGTW